MKPRPPWNQSLTAFITSNIVSDQKNAKWFLSNLSSNSQEFWWRHHASVLLALVGKKPLATTHGISSQEGLMVLIPLQYQSGSIRSYSLIPGSISCFINSSYYDVLYSPSISRLLRRSWAWWWEKPSGVPLYFVVCWWLTATFIYYTLFTTTAPQISITLALSVDI